MSGSGGLRVYDVWESASGDVFGCSVRFGLSLRGDWVSNGRWC